MSTEFFNDQWRIPSNENQNKISNYSMEFDGSGQQIEASTLSVTGNWSVSMWVNSNSTAYQTAMQLSSATTTGAQDSTIFIRNTFISNLWGFYDGASTLAGSVLNTGQWYNLVVTKNGTTYTLYLNGTQENQGTLNNINITDLLIGRRSNNNFYFNGKIDQVTVFDYELSQDQVTLLGLDGYAFNFIPNDYIDFGYFPLLSGATSATVSLWYNRTRVANEMIFDFLETPAGSGGRVGMQIHSNGSYVYINGNNYNHPSSASIGDWANFVLVFNGAGATNEDKLKIYLDGTELTGGTYSGTIDNAIGTFTSSSMNSIIGTLATLQSNVSFQGELSNVAIFNSNLLDPEIATLYNNGKPSDISSLNPVAWYKLDNSELFNGAEWSVDNSKYPSVYESSLNFSGNNQYLQVPDSNDFSFGNGTTDSPFSLSAWINPDAVEFAGIAAKYVTNGWEWLFYLTDSNELRLQLLSNNTSGNSITLTTDVAIPINTWTHVSATYNANRLSNGIDLYINGLPQSLVTEGGAGTYQAMTNTTAPLQIGTWAGSFRPISGQVSNVSIWDAELTQAQVSEIYNNGTPSNLSSHSATSNLISWWELDNTTTGLQDSKGSNNASNIGTTKYDGFVNTLAGESEGMNASSLVISDINGELIVNPMITSPKPIAYYQLGDQSVDNGANYLVPNNSLSDYVFNFVNPFDGINVPSSNVFSFGTGNFTISMWFKINSFPYLPYLFDFRPTSAPSTASPVVYITTTKQITLGGGGTIIPGNAGEILATNIWYNFVVKRTGNTFTTHYNGGSADRTGTSNVDFNTDLELHIGSRFDNANGFDGEISNFQVFNTALPQTGSNSIETIYNNGSPLTSMSGFTSLQAWYKLNASEVFNSTSTEWSVDNNAHPSVYKSSLDFDGSSNYVNCGNDSSLQITGAMTISYWVKGTSTLGAAGVGTLEDSASPGYLLGPSTTGAISFNLALSSSTTKNVTTTQQITTTEWHHIVGVYTPGVSMKIYIDGQLSKTETSNIPYSQYVGGNDFRIGYRTCCKIDGQISNVAIWNTDLSSPEVNTLYNNGTPEASISHSPVSWWKLDNITTGIQDSAGSNNGTNNGATEYAGFVNALAGESVSMDSSNLVVSDLQQTSGYSPYALDFDGINDYLDCGGANDFSFTNGSGTDLPFSLSAWINMDDASGFRIITKYGTGTDVEWYLYTTGSDILRFRLYDKNNTSTIGRGYGTPLTSYQNKWINVVATYNGNEQESGIKLYINGLKVDDQPASTGNYQGMVTTTNPVTIGKMGTAYASGKISNASIFNTELTSTQVTEIYNEGVPSNLNNFSGTAPVSWWQIGSNSSFNPNPTGTEGTWTCLDEIGTNNAIGSANMTNDDITNGPGYSANGLGTSSIDIKGDAPYSTANGLSENMDVLDRVRNTPINLQPITNTHSIQLDGIDAYIDFGDSDDLSFGSASGDLPFSISGWVKPADIGATFKFRFIRKAPFSNSNGWEYVIGTNGSGLLNFLIYGNNSSTRIGKSPSVAITSTAWQHWAFTYDGTGSTTGTNSGMKIYVNGVEASSYIDSNSGIYTGMTNGSAPLSYGVAWGTSGLDYAEGLIDEVAIFNVELTGPQVAAIYNGGTPNNILPLSPVLWSRFESLTTNAGVVTTADDSGNGLTGTVENGAVLSTIVP